MTTVPICPICKKPMDDCKHDIEDLIPLIPKEEVISIRTLKDWIEYHITRVHSTPAEIINLIMKWEN